MTQTTITQAFHEWVQSLKQYDDFGGVTNRTSEGEHGGDVAKARVWFDDAPDELIDAINDGHVRVRDSGMIGDDAPAYKRDEPAGSMTITPTEKFSPAQ